MPLPIPEPGLVVGFRYLWRHEFEAGKEEGRKDRPCAIVLVVRDSRGRMETVVAPITHSEPKPPAEGIEIPQKVKAHLGLDSARSWIIVTDLNSFVWPGFDLVPIPGSKSNRFDYGMLPPRLFDMVLSRIQALRSLEKATSRT